MTLFAASTHPGLVRNRNEDSYEAEPELGLWLVADGVGGHADGDVAATIVAETIKADVVNGTPLLDAIKHAHVAVLDEIKARGSKSNMGSTVVAMRMHDHNYEIAWVGDSRAYLFDGKLRQLTEDHNPVSELLRRGAITAEQAAHHPERHVLSQSLGVSSSIAVNPGQISGKLKPGQQVLLCSDGLTDELSDRAITAHLRKHREPASQVDALVNAALGLGGRDNITAVLVGTPAKGARVRAPAAPDMETTQNIGAAVRSMGEPRRSHANKLWILLAITGFGGLFWLLQ